MAGALVVAAAVIAVVLGATDGVDDSVLAASVYLFAILTLPIAAGLAAAYGLLRWRIYRDR